MLPSPLSLPLKLGNNSSGFTLIQVSVILTVMALVMVAVLPSYQAHLKANSVNASKMYSIMTALRQYQVVYGNLPCPADPTIAIGNGNYGVASANGGTINNCVTGSAPNAAYADSTNHIAIGMLPVKSLALSYDSAIDGFSRNITYAVDTGATGCWASSSLPGAITVNDNGINHNTVAALVSHGKNGYGAWLPTQGTGGSGSGTRFNSGSTDTSEAANAEVAAGGGLTPLAAGQFVSFVNQPQTATFDDMVIYRNNLYNMNALPLVNGTPKIIPPVNGTYPALSPTITFTLTFPGVVTVTGTPRLDLSALSGTGILIGTGGGASGNGTTVGYANYQSGSGTNTLTFTYIVGGSDNAPNGIAVATPIDLNGGTILQAQSICFITPNLSGIILAPSGYLWVADRTNNKIIEITTGGSLVNTFASTGTSDTQLTSPTDVIIDGSNNIWVADSGNNRVVEYDFNGVWQSTIGGNIYSSNHCSGKYATSTTCNPISGYSSYCCAQTSASCTCSTGSTNGQFNMGTGKPTQIAFDGTGNLWASDYYNNRVQKFYGSNGSGTTIGQYIANITDATSHSPSGVAVDKNGYIWVIYPGNAYCSLWKCTAGGSCTAYGGCTAASGGTGLLGPFNNKYTDADFIAVDAGNNIWVTDESGCAVREFNSSTGAYMGSLAYSFPSCTVGSGTGPTGIAIDSGGNFWIASTVTNNVYKISSNGTLLQTIGSGSPVTFGSPYGVFISSR